VILVTGATGRVGYRLLEKLADAGAADAAAAAMVRVEARVADLPGSPECVVASLDEPPPAETLQAFDRVFLLSPALEEQAELEIVFIDALVAAGHRPHVVKVAADGFADPGCEIRFVRSHREVAAHLNAVDLPVTYLAPAPYLENLLASAEDIRTSGTLRLPAGHGRVALVGVTDVAAAAAAVLTGTGVAGTGHEGQTYTLTGPELVNFTQVAKRISEVFARQVSYSSETAGKAREALLARGLDRWTADGVLELYEWIREGGAAAATPTVRELTGADPQSVQDWLEENRAGFLDPEAEQAQPAF